MEEESEVFEITDFTTASEWERFIARIEEVIHEWKLNKSQSFQPLLKGDFSKPWAETTETITFADFQFTVTRHCLKLANMDQEADLGVEDDQTEGVPITLQDMMSLENDFPARAHCLSRWYGLRDFVVLTPTTNTEALLAESKSNLVLSSIAIAVNNTRCQVPLFIQVHQKWRRLYCGLSEWPGIRTNYGMVHLKNIPSQYNHLAGLLDMFKAKLACCAVSVPPVQVSVRFTYILQDWPHYAWTQVPPDFDAGSGSNVGLTDFETLPWGACQDPVNELHLAATWTAISEEMLVDNDSYSDLDPLQAPIWSVRVKLTEDPQCLLGEYLRDYLRLCRRRETVEQLLPNFSLDDTEGVDVSASAALERLTQPAVQYKLPSLSQAVSGVAARRKKQSQEMPMNGDLLNAILMFLFPDAKLDVRGPSVEEKGQGQDDVADETTHAPTQAENEIKHLLHQLKSAPIESVTHKLAVCLCLVHHSYGGIKAVAHLWQEFVLEMRYRWENNYYIPLLDKSIPNMGCSLIHQKLQMLNCCIERKIKREAKAAEINDTLLHQSVSSSNISGGVNPRFSRIRDGAAAPSSSSNQVQSNSNDSSTDEDEFFECNDNSSEVSSKSSKTETNKDNKDIDNEGNNEEDMETDTPGVADGQEPTIASDTSSAIDIIATKNKSETKSSQKSVGENNAETLPYKPEGRLRQCGDLTLLNLNELLYIPVTQEPAPMTEDMLEQHAEVLTKLGSTAEGSHLRARMQSACLISDMESFKAANPGCVLADFVRWYSPRDWSEEQQIPSDSISQTKGELSQRMQIPGNMWVEVWTNAKPIPARRQKRLFDDTKEAEKVLHWLSGLKPSEAAVHLFPMLLHAGVLRLANLPHAPLPSATTILNQATTRAIKLTRDPNATLKAYEEVVQQIGLAETIIARGDSIRHKFQQQSSGNGAATEKFVRSLLEQPDVPVIGAARGPEGKVIHQLFAEVQKSSMDIEGEEAVPGRGKVIGDFPQPSGREFILRTEVPRPAPYSRSTPQRLYAVLMDKDVRLAGAFSEDTTFQ